MKKQINPTIKAHLVRSAFYVLLLLAVCVIPFALAQRNTSNRSIVKPKATAKLAAVGKQTGAPASLVGKGPAAAPGTNRFSRAPAGAHKAITVPKGTVCAYDFTTGSATFVPGVDDLNLDCDDCGADVPLPFSVTLYGQSFATAHVGSNGHCTFGTFNDGFSITCSPFGFAGTTDALAPYWGDQTVFAVDGHGVFTTTTGSAPNRVFYVEWRSRYFGSPDELNYEVALYENGTPPFSYIYNTITPATAANDSELTVGQKQDDVCLTQYGCDTTGGQSPPVSSGLVLDAVPLGTPTPTPTCPPGNPTGAGAWTAGNPYPTTIVRYGFVQTATDFYVFGGVDNGSITNAVNKYNVASGTWTPLAPMPFSGEAPTCSLMDATGIVYCADGTAGNDFASYDIATDSWTPLASDPFATDHYGSASGAFNGKVFVAGGTSGITNQVDVYDVGTDTWSPGTPAPSAFLLAGYQQLGQFLYVVGGFDPTFVNNATTWRLDLSSGTWDNGPAFTPQLADFGLAYDAGTNKLYSLGGDLPNDGNPFASTNQVNELDVSGWPGGTWNPSPPDLPLPNRQANQAGFFGGGQIWSVGGLDGSTFQFLNEVWSRTNGGCAGPCTLGPWNIVADYPFAGESVSVSSDGTVAYAVGGFDPNIGPTNAFNQYDPVADSWTPLPSIPTGFYDAPSVYDANTNRVYVFGGFDTTFAVRDIVQIYDVASNTWVANGTPMPDPAGRYFAAAVYYPADGRIYVFGGFDGATFSEQTNAWAYDPVTDTWDTSLAPIPVAMGGAGYSIVGQNAYLSGHWNGGLGSTDNYRYDIVANTWTAMAPVPVNIYRPASGAIGTNAYLVGGGDPFVSANAQRSRKGRKAAVPASAQAPATSFNSTWVYDTVADSWSPGPNTNVAHSFTGGTALGNSFVVVTGYNGSNDTATVEKSDCGAVTPSPTPTATATATGSPGGNCPPVLTESTTQNIVSGNSVSCNNGFGHTDNSYWRAFNMSTFTGGQEYDVTSVDFAIEQATSGTGTQPVEVHIYANHGAPFPGGDWQSNMIANSGPISIPDQSLTIFNQPITVAVPAGTLELVYELFTPNGENDGNLFFVGSNPDGQSADSYLSAADCGVTVPTPTQDIGFPNMMIVFNVNGSCPGGVSPTPTATATATAASPTPTATATATATATTPPASPTPTATATATTTPRPTPTPRPRPTPYPRPTP